MKRKNEIGEDEFGIYEVYYDKNKRIEGWTENSMVTVCESRESLDHQFDLMKMAFEKEILNYDKE